LNIFVTFFEKLELNTFYFLLFWLLFLLFIDSVLPAHSFLFFNFLQPYFVTHFLAIQKSFSDQLLFLRQIRSSPSRAQSRHILHSIQNPLENFQLPYIMLAQPYKNMFTSHKLQNPTQSPSVLTHQQRNQHHKTTTITTCWKNNTTKRILLCFFYKFLQFS